MKMNQFLDDAKRKVMADQKRASQLTKEMKRLSKAVNRFAFSMKCRLNEQIVKGYLGWDGAVSGETLLRDINTDIAKLNNGTDKTIDVANRIMFLWYRQNIRTEKGVAKTFNRRKSVDKS